MDKQYHKKIEVKIGYRQLQTDDKLMAERGTIELQQYLIDYYQFEKNKFNKVPLKYLFLLLFFYRPLQVFF
ncbi:hypothetical protein B1F79_03705, partial [Coxiella-like endosymbiont of Rhipicephalus sanguineus]|uniref:hypothetical protein n=1 Tax=Coxiella-like endosymbiont of Rhipicephalus sanguineus TaxID=1955402 RepID=UPI00204012F0